MVDVVVEATVVVVVEVDVGTGTVVVVDVLGATGDCELEGPPSSAEPEWSLPPCPWP